MIGTDMIDHSVFIKTHTRLLPVSYVPEIQLFLADEATALWQKTEDELGQIGLPPPFWAFAWAGGQALARFILDNPALVRGKTILDFASGSGLIAIAAKMAGAAQVMACDIDAFAITAISENATANDVVIQSCHDNLIGTDHGWDVIFAGDVSYERDMAESVTQWLQKLHQRGATVLIGDPGRTYLARPQLEMIAEYQVPVPRTLEDMDIKISAVWAFKTISASIEVD